MKDLEQIRTVVDNELIAGRFERALNILTNLIVKLGENLQHEVRTKLAQVKDGKDGRNGKDGKDGKNGRDGRDGRDGADGATGPQGIQGVPGQNGLNGSPDTADDIRNKLELLPDGEKLGIFAIQDLEDRLKKLEKRPIATGGWSSASGGKIVKSYDLSDQLNGVKTTFAMPAFWRVISVHLSSFPNILRPTTDYTVSADAMTITFTSEINPTSLAAGQSLIVVYAEA